MTPFVDLPIRRKVAFVILLTSTIVLALTASAFMTYEWVTFRRAAQANLTTVGRLIAENVVAALRFRNDADVRDTLDSLRSEPDIVLATVLDENNRVVAHYSTNKAPPPDPERARTPGDRFEEGRLVHSTAIVAGGRQYGVLFIESSLAAMQRRFALYGGLVFAILATSMLVAFALSSRLQERITLPVQELAKAAQAIATRGDYSVRAARYGNDELGALTDAFNRMLEEIKEREARLSASEERLRVALAAADTGTWRYYPDRRESMVDENFRRMYSLGEGAGAVALAQILERIHPDDREPLQSALRGAMEGPDNQLAIEYRILLPEGRLRWVRDRGRVIRRADGAIDYVTGALVDITERKLSEEEIRRLNASLELRVAERTAELEQANHELEAFIYSVSHDLRAPLRHIEGYAEMIREDTDSHLSHDGKSSLGRITYAAQRLTKLVDSLLNLSRVGRRQPTMQEVKLDDVVILALRELEAEMKDRRIEWQRAPLPVVTGDPALLQIVFVNLLSNALKYSRRRDVARISIGTEVSEGKNAVFVRDNGVGFDPRFKSKLFGVFERLHAATEFEGTGVGLATVDRVLRKHGGRIWADAEVDRGATFYFTLPGM